MRGNEINIMRSLKEKVAAFEFRSKDGPIRFYFHATLADGVAIEGEPDSSATAQSGDTLLF
jgi:hypothetical protein